jgi:hypothetical protein
LKSIILGVSDTPPKEVALVARRREAAEEGVERMVMDGKFVVHFFAKKGW